MAKTKKDPPAPKVEPAPDEIPADSPAVSELPPPIQVEIPPPIQVEIPRDRLWELYVARVAKAETVHTMRRDGRAIFRDAFIEAQVALEVFDTCVSETKKG